MLGVLPNPQGKSGDEKGFAKGRRSSERASERGESSILLSSPKMRLLPEYGNFPVLGNKLKFGINSGEKVSQRRLIQIPHLKNFAAPGNLLLLS